MDIPRGVSLERLITCVDELPACAEVLPRLRRMLADPDLDGMDLAGLLRLDIGLATRVLRLSNTVFYSGGQKVASVEEAIVRVGYLNLSKLINQVVFSEILAGPLRTYGLGAGDLWRESVLCAVSMEVLAEARKRSSDVCFTIGLLHGVGMVIINRHLSNNGVFHPVMGRPWDSRVLDREREWVGFDHAQVGSALLTAWGFPETVTEAISFQHAPASCRTVPKLAGLLHVALWLKGTVLPELGAERPMRPEGFPLRLAGFTEKGLDALVPIARQRLNEALELAHAI